MRQTSFFGSILILILTLTVVSVRSLRAQFSDDIDIVFTVAQQDEIRVGDLLEATLSVRHPKGYRVVFPTLPQVWGDYEVREQHLPQTIDNKDGSETTSQTLIITLFAPGTYQTPGIDLQILAANEQPIERAVPQLSLTVLSLLGPDEPELRDIKPQADLQPPWPWAWIVGGWLLAIILLLLLLWLYRWWRARGAETPSIFVPTPVIDTRPAYIIALEELDRIERLDLPGQGRFKEFYSLVTDCLRFYLGGMYHIPAIDLTTTETRLALQRSPLAPEHSSAFIGLFTEGDLVKFARFVPPRDKVLSVIDQARALVEATKIIAVETDPAEAEAVSQEVA